MPSQQSTAFELPPNTVVYNRNGDQSYSFWDRASGYTVERNIRPEESLERDPVNRVWSLITARAPARDTEDRPMSRMSSTQEPSLLGSSGAGSAPIRPRTGQPTVGSGAAGGPPREMNGIPRGQPSNEGFIGCSHCSDLRQANPKLSKLTCELSADPRCQSIEGIQCCATCFATNKRDGTDEYKTCNLAEVRLAKAKARSRNFYEAQCARAFTEKQSRAAGGSSQHGGSR